jgi:hypothetical protein
MENKIIGEQGQRSNGNIHQVPNIHCADTCVTGRGEECALLLDTLAEV